MHHLALNPAAILALAVSIYGVLQAAKKVGLDGYISGRLGMAFNVAFGFIATVAIAGNLQVETLFTALVVALTAAGVHANVKVTANGTLAAPSPAPVIGKAAVLVLALLLPAAVALNGCARNVSPTIPAAAQTAELGANITDSVAKGLKLAQDSLRTLHQGGQITDAEAATLNGWLVNVAQKNDAAIAAVQAAEASGAGTGWQASLQAVAAAAGALQPSAFNIANPNAKTTFTLAIGTFEAAVAVINANFN